MYNINLTLYKLIFLLISLSFYLKKILYLTNVVLTLNFFLHKKTEAECKQLKTLEMKFIHLNKKLKS